MPSDFSRVNTCVQEIVAFLLSLKRYPAVKYIYVNDNHTPSMNESPQFVNSTFEERKMEKKKKGGGVYLKLYGKLSLQHQFA